MALNYSPRKEFEAEFYTERDNGIIECNPSCGGIVRQRRTVTLEWTRKFSPFEGMKKKERRKKGKKGKEIGRSFSFISPTPRFENLKTRRGVAQVRIAQTQSTHQSRGTDAYRWLACSQSSTKGHFPSVSIIDDRPARVSRARVKRLTNCEKKIYRFTKAIIIARTMHQ